MTATIDEVQAALKAALATISGLDAHATEPDSAGAKPVAYPRLVPSLNEFDADFAGDCAWQFDVWVLVSIGDRGTNRAQTTLHPYLSPGGTNSLKAAIESDPTLGNVVSSARVKGLSNYGTTSFEGIPARFLAASVRVEVLA